MMDNDTHVLGDAPGDNGSQAAPVPPTAADRIAELEATVADLKTAVARLQQGRCKCGHLIVVARDNYPAHAPGKGGVPTIVNHSQERCG
jgi:hypothetical protein